MNFSSQIKSMLTSWKTKSIVSSGVIISVLKIYWTNLIFKCLCFLKNKKIIFETLLKKLGKRIIVLSFLINFTTIVYKMFLILNASNRYLQTENVRSTKLKTFEYERFKEKKLFELITFIFLLQVLQEQCLQPQNQLSNQIKQKNLWKDYVMNFHFKLQNGRKQQFQMILFDQKLKLSNRNSIIKTTVLTLMNR